MELAKMPTNVEVGNQQPWLLSVPLDIVAQQVSIFMNMILSRKMQERSTNSSVEANLESNNTAASNMDGFLRVGKPRVSDLCLVTPGA